MWILMKQEMTRLAVASAGSYANHFHLAPGGLPRQHLITQFLAGQMLFLTPNQQCQSTEGRVLRFKNYKQYQ